MSNRHIHQGLVVEIAPRLLGRSFWLLTETAVSINAQVVSKTNSALYDESNEEAIEDATGKYKVKVDIEQGKPFALNRKYTVSINNKVVIDEFMSPTNRSMRYVGILAIIFLALAISYTLISVIL